MINFQNSTGLKKNNSKYQIIASDEKHTFPAENSRPVVDEAVKGHPNADEAGGLSGAPLTKHSTEVIGQFHQGLGKDIPTIGAGGIFSAEDALAKRDAGASLVQLYTGFVYRGPALIHEIIKAW